MKDWKKKFDRLMNPGKAIMEGDVGVYAFWEAIGNYGEWNRPKVVEVIRPILESLFSEQEAEHKKQMREAIEEVGKELEDSEGDAAFAAGLETALDIFVKHNCEKRKK